MRKFLPISIAVVLVTVGLLAGFGRERERAPQGMRLAAQAPAADLSGFERADGPRRFAFPADHGAHPDYQTEWWYYTGNLAAADGRRFGFQLTFFRRALLPASQMPERASDWATGQVYMAHFAISDIGADRYHAFERLARGAAGLAGALPGPSAAERNAPFRVWLEDWQATQAAPPGDCAPSAAPPCAYTLRAAQDDVALELELVDMRTPTLQGERGYSRKGADPGQASYYYSLTRLQSRGALTLGGERFEVSGWSWMDHEWSTSALAADQIGWDWFSIQLENGLDLMVFQIRRADGRVDPFSSGMLVYPDGRTRALARDDFSIEVTERWKSPHSGAVYPAGWTVRIPGEGIRLRIAPLMADQELNLSYAYWEGAVQVQAQVGDTPTGGHGYVELTGYSGSLGGEF